MAKISVGMAFSGEFAAEGSYSGADPLAHIGVKKPVYMRFLALCKKQGWDTYVLTRKTYKGAGVFEGAWKFADGSFERIKDPVRIDLVYDRCAGVKFPPIGDKSLIWINERDFKVLAWDKWKGYQEIGEYMPKTFFLEKESDIKKYIDEISTDWVVIKPYNGLKGLGIYIGPKGKLVDFKFNKKYKHYIMQEFIDTSDGILDITPGLHDLRVTIVNGQAVWSHIRVPKKGSFTANAAQGGTLTEIDYHLVPRAVKQIVEKVSGDFYEKYNNPIYSLDFGLQKGQPYIFEINDQIGFPKWEMKNRDAFLNALIKNFKQSIRNSLTLIPLWRRPQ